MPDRQLHTEQHLFITWTPGARCCTYLCTEDARLLPWTFDARRLQNGCLCDSSRRGDHGQVPGRSPRRFSANRWAAGGPASSAHCAAQPKGRAGQRAPKVWGQHEDWPNRYQIRGLNSASHGNLLRWGFKQRDEADDLPEFLDSL